MGIRTSLGGALVLVAAAALAAPAARAVVVQKTYVGTFSNPLTSHATSDPANNNPGMIARGNKYVVIVSYDTDDVVPVDASARFFQNRNFFSIPLDEAPGGTNTYQVWIPSEGFGEILSQTGQDHFVIAGDTAQTAEIHFFSSCNSEASCDAAFRGFEFESNFIRSNSPTTPDPTGDLIFEQRDPDASFGSETVTNYVVNVLDGNDPGLQGVMFNGGHVDVLSESGSGSGGQLTPGVFFAEAVPVVAEAGASPLVYDAGTLTRVTHAGTEQRTESPVAIVPGQVRAAPSTIDAPTRQADNDLGAGRSDLEDFLSYAWTVDGMPVAGNLDGTRLDRIVETLDVADPLISPHGSRFALAGNRTVEDVNIQVAIENSGLQTTLDVVHFDLEVSEALTGLSDTDSVEVRYANALPVIQTALATPVAGGDVQFDLAYGDADLAVNALGLTDFELLEVGLFLEGSPFAGLSQLLATGSETLTASALQALFGIGPATLEVRVSDRFLARSSSFVNAFIPFEVVPEPCTGALLLPVLLALGLGARTGRASR
jgi:hypothetical protein